MGKHEASASRGDSDVWEILSRCNTSKGIVHDRTCNSTCRCWAITICASSKNDTRQSAFPQQNDSHHNCIAYMATSISRFLDTA